MSSDLEQQLAPLVANAEWNRPLPPLPDLGHAAINRALAALELGQFAEALAALQLAGEFPAAELLSAGDAIEASVCDAPWDPRTALAPLPSELLPTARLQYKRRYDERIRRRLLLQRWTFTLDQRSSPELQQQMHAWLERPCSPLWREALASSLLGYRHDPLVGFVRTREARASREVLAALQLHAKQADPLLGFGLEAAFALDPSAALERVSALLAASDAEAGRAVLAAVAARLGSTLPYASEPRWAALLAPVFSALDSVGLASLNQLVAAGSSAPLLAALPFVTEDVVFETLCSALRDNRDVSVLAALSALPVGGLGARKRALQKTVAVLKKVSRGTAPVRCGSLGSSGGPLLLLPDDVARGWVGAVPEPGAERSPDAASALYERVVAAVRGKAFAVLAELRGLALEATACDCFVHAGRWYFVTDGDGAALMERAPRAKRASSWAIGPGGVWLMDSASPWGAANADPPLQLQISAGQYAVCVQRAANGDAAVVLVRES